MPSRFMSEVGDRPATSDKLDNVASAVAARDRGETAESEEDVIAGCCLLLMICNTDGTSWRRPRKPPKLSHWRRKIFPEMGRPRRSRERGWHVIVTNEWR
jgi:hypothetical protein